MERSRTTRALRALATLLALGVAGSAAAQDGEVLVGTYNYGWIGADLGTACGLSSPAVLTRMQLGTAVFDPSGTVTISVEQRTGCPGGATEDETLLYDGTYFLDEGGELVLDLDPLAPGTEVAVFHMTWDRTIGTLAFDRERDAGRPGLGVLLRRPSGLDPSAVLGEYTLTRMRQSQVASGVEMRGSFGTITFEPGGTYTQTVDSRTISPSGSTTGEGLTTTGTYTVQPDGTLLIDGGLHVGAVTPDGAFGLLERKAAFGSILAVFARTPTVAPTPWALDDLWWLAFYGGGLDDGPAVELAPNAETGVLSFDAQSGQVLVGHTEVQVRSSGGDAQNGFSFFPFERRGSAAYVLTPDPGKEVPARLGRAEDVLLFADLTSPDEVLVGLAPRAWGPLAGDGHELGVAAGGVQTLSVRSGAVHGTQLYLVLGSLSGTYPGFPQGSTVVPLNFDGYTQLTLTQPNLPPLASSLGVLDERGAAAATFTLPAGASPALVGLELHHAVLVLDPAAAEPVVLASNPVRLVVTS